MEKKNSSIIFCKKNLIISIFLKGIIKRKDEKKKITTQKQLFLQVIYLSKVNGPPVLHDYPVLLNNM